MTLKQSKTNQSWGGRFKQETDAFVKIFGASVSFDKVLAPYDIQGSIAHATMLAKVGVLTTSDKDTIIQNLNIILDEINNDKFNWSIDLEDVHMNIEARLIELCGEVGKKLHTGRSRNDQVATDIRLYLRDKSYEILEQIKVFQKSLLILGKEHTQTIMPSFTHLQAAQPISFAHHLMAYFSMLERDYERLENCLKRINSLPLGAAALAGTTYPIDRELTAKLLDFDRVCENSLDAVSDRDFVIEFNAFASILMMHLSRFSEEIVLWVSSQFNFIELSDSFCTGSSIMPQKKNPDVPELVRGKTARVYGNLMSILTLMKSQPLAYNKDNQEDKEPLFDTVKTLNDCLFVFAKMIPEIKVNQEVMLKSAKLGFTTATDLADYLVKKGVAFRDAHEVVGKVVAYCLDNKQNLDEISLQKLQQFSEKIEENIFDVLSLEGSLNARNHLGGTASEQVLKFINHKQKTL
jgi:argininosuccinate lyase